MECSKNHVGQRWARDSIEMSELRLEVIRSEIQVQKVI